MFITVCGLSVIAFPLLRAAAVIFQVKRKRSIVKGPCLVYKFVDNRITAVPFSKNCLNYLDYAILLAAVIAPFASLFYKAGNVEDPIDKFVKDYNDAKTKLDATQHWKTHTIFKLEKKKLLALEILRLVPREKRYIKLIKTKEFFNMIVDALLSRVYNQEILKTPK